MTIIFHVLLPQGRWRGILDVLVIDLMTRIYEFYSLEQISQKD
ncbi:hypothetical protein SeseC_00886 [Streptococcus equi subsp. zooepidemicus ATCC 35246]|nr:hypothetical protein SeseC_00886 [Streptococcus equi subsp. zooepidemicus ATCC 35246]QBX15300.1 hypothetical protein Javan181_0008 [Streptococcus phage Javan181]